MNKKTYFELNIRPNHRDAYWKDGAVHILNRSPYVLDDEINWLDDPFTHRSWRWLLNNFKWMDSLLYNYIVNDDDDSIVKCVEYFLSWYKFYITDERQGEFLWKDDAVSFRAFRVAVIARYILDSERYSKENKKIAREAVSLHYDELIDERKFKRNNHGLFQVRGLMALSVLHSDVVDLKRAFIYAERKINYLWSQQYGKQCLHLENSTGYHQLTIREFDEILKSPEFSAANLVYNKDHVAKAIDNTKYFYHPNGSSTLFGDTNLSYKDIPKFTGDRIFNEAGYAFLAGRWHGQENSYLAVRTGFPSNIHRHSDDFSFEWSEYGKVIFQDSGRFSYDYDDPCRMFLTSTRAHNTVTVNGGNYPWWGSFNKQDFYKGAVSSYEASDDAVVIELEKEFSDIDVVFTRKMKLERRHLLVVTDDLKSSSPNSYEQWFHLEESFFYEGENEFGCLVFKSEAMQLVFTPPSNVNAVIVKGQDQPFMQGWVSYKEKQISPRYSVGFIVDGKDNFVFNTKIEIFPFKPTV